MIDSSFLLRNFVNQKIIRVINSFIVHLNAACASLEDIIKPTPLLWCPVNCPRLIAPGGLGLGLDWG